jgi:subfamily B ATP-binding cassette protein HlyB/CyaB
MGGLTLFEMKKLDVNRDPFFWILQGLCAILRRPFSLELATQQFVAPYTSDRLTAALAEYALDARHAKVRASKLHKESFPLLAWLTPEGADAAVMEQGRPALVLQATDTHVLLAAHEKEAPDTITVEQFARLYTGWVTRVAPQPAAAGDPDSDTDAQSRRRFGFSWFVPELLKHRKLWQEILLASLVIQLIALATPLFTQAIIDKVVVHHTRSTLVVIGIGMAVFMLFSASLSWLRQYLVLHTGNRVDAILGASVFERLFKLPPLYFQHRATGVISARLHGVETIREFIASAGVTLVLDFPFLLIFVGIMFYYSVSLSLIVLAVLALIAAMSLVVAPLFQTRLQQQFQLGARNQAFVTEYVVGLETVKSLQLEPQLGSKYSGYLADYLRAGFDTKQLANSYNTVANLLEQGMTLLILVVGAYTVMNDSAFTIGMLVAFQMFAGKLSQPVLRIVGLWQQFQQASLSVARLGDLMNAPVEPYSSLPARDGARKGEIRIESVAFRYSEEAPLVYEDLSLQVRAGQAIAIMGPSGCGKSTLAKLLQGFYQPSAGRILVDGIDIRYLTANELRSNFGVVPQETVLFSGTIYDNLQMASPDASFEQITAACRMAEIHAVIEALPKGYQTEIGERGAGLSGGQRQRIAIARALLKRPAILVFDEATSALDGATSEQFAQTINALKGKVTMVFITHALPKGLKLDAVFRLTSQGAQLLKPAASLARTGTGTDGARLARVDGGEAQ